MSNNPLPAESRRRWTERCHAIRTRLIQEGIYRSPQPGADPYDRAAEDANDLWRIAAEPFLITPRELNFLESLGNHLLAFYEAVNRLYFDSIHGRAPAWVADTLDRGKPENVVAYGRMNRFKHDLPGIIRPDLIPTEEGMVAAELDSIPGGIGLTGGLTAAYSLKPSPEPSREPSQWPLVGMQEGMASGFEGMIRSLVNGRDIVSAIVVSEESKAYRPEMEWLGRALRKRGLSAYVADPREILFTEEGLWLEVKGKRERIDVLYRFFELFDLKNIPKAELILYAAKKRQVVLTPPPKAHLEEKSLYALFHHPALRPFWRRQLGEGVTAVLEDLFPKSWIMDSREVPPHAVIPDLTIRDRPVTDFRQLGGATQKERRFVIKPSGFSELAWGSRGVAVGHDLPEGAWREAIDRALQSFSTRPYLLQRFHKGKKVAVAYYDFEKGGLVQMEGRARLTPYYFVEGKEARLGGVLATVCSLEKKLIHGMVDAVMAPCAVSAV
ncbi:MAG: hypothetical protein ACE5HN_00965 [Nitrospiria bacterium]